MCSPFVVNHVQTCSCQECLYSLLVALQLIVGGFRRSTALPSTVSPSSSTIIGQNWLSSWDQCICPAVRSTVSAPAKELTASTSGISDADGLDNASFAYQWIRTGADIGGATGSTYTAVAADEGKTLKVRVSFTDDAGNAESLTSAATDAVALASEPLTASFEGMPAEHAGQGSFSFRVAFSDGLNISYKTMRDASFRVTGGDVTKASRVDSKERTRSERLGTLARAKS